MITVKTLRELLAKLPDNAQVSAYEGEDIGLHIEYGKKRWWIRARASLNQYVTQRDTIRLDEDTYTKGFEEETSILTVQHENAQHISAVQFLQWLDVEIDYRINECGTIGLPQQVKSALGRDIAMLKNVKRVAQNIMVWKMPTGEEK